MVVSAARATTLASSVLPEPGGPSAKTGFCIWAARYITLSVTGSVTYLAASSFSDNSWIEKNTRRGSLKPHAKAESFRGLLNFSVSRQNCPVTGSPEDLPIQRRTMSLVHFLYGTTFPHSLCVGGGEKGYHFGGDGGDWSPAFHWEPFPLDRRACSERPGVRQGRAV